MRAYLAGSFSSGIQAQELVDPSSRFLIAELDGITVGYARLMVAEAPEVVPGQRPIEIVRFYARKQWIGKGIGGELMRSCLIVAKGAGCDVIWLGVWEKNLRGIIFYRKWGFVEAGKQVFQLGDDPQCDLLMVRNVSQDGV